VIPVAPKLARVLSSLCFHSLRVLKSQEVSGETCKPKLEAISAAGSISAEKCHIGHYGGHGGLEIWAATFRSDEITAIDKLDLVGCWIFSSLRVAGREKLYDSLRWLCLPSGHDAGRIEPRV